MKNIFEQVEKNIDNLVLNSVDWTACASKEQLQAARAGKLRWLQVQSIIYATILMMKMEDITRLYIECLFVLRIMMTQSGLNMGIRWKII